MSQSAVGVGGKQRERNFAIDFPSRAFPPTRQSFLRVCKSLLCNHSRYIAENEDWMPLIECWGWSFTSTADSWRLIGTIKTSTVNWTNRRSAKAKKKTRIHNDVDRTIEVQRFNCPSGSLAYIHEYSKALPNFNELRNTKVSRDVARVLHSCFACNFLTQGIVFSNELCLRSQLTGSYHGKPHLENANKIAIVVVI